MDKSVNLSYIPSRNFHKVLPDLWSTAMNEPSSVDKNMIPSYCKTLTLAKLLSSYNKILYALHNIHYPEVTHQADTHLRVIEILSIHGQQAD